MEQQATAQQPAQQSFNQAKGGSKGWMIAAIICALGFLGTGGYTIYNLVSGNSDTQKDASEGSGTANCDIKEEVSEVTEADTGGIAKTQSGDYQVSLFKSGIKLNLGSDFEFINIDYSSNAPYDENWSERLAIGGLSANTTGAQNIPDFATGKYEFTGGAQDELKHEWAALAFLDVYSKSYWDTTIQPAIDEAKANGGPAAWGDVVYSDDEYVVSYTHPQNVLSPAGWEQDWELVTVSALETAIKNSDNWSR